MKAGLSNKIFSFFWAIQGQLVWFRHAYVLVPLVKNDSNEILSRLTRRECLPWPYENNFYKKIENQFSEQLYTICTYSL